MVGNATNGLVGVSSHYSYATRSSLFILLKYLAASAGNNVRHFHQTTLVPCNKFSILLLFIAINRFKLILCQRCYSIKECFALNLLSRLSIVLFCIIRMYVSKYGLVGSCYKPIYITLQGYKARNLSL